MSRIILIDDDQDLPELTRSFLVNEGYEVLIFHEAESAIAEIKRHKPDLILMDVMLPGINGAEAIQEIRKDPKLHNIPVIFLTGLVSSQDKDLMEIGVNVAGLKYKILAKPYGSKELLELVENMLD